MIIDDAKAFWTLCQDYRRASADDRYRALLLNGEALLVLQQTPSEAVKKRANEFIDIGCVALGVTNKSAYFQKS